MSASSADTPISGPERLALRNCLQDVIDHVTEAQALLDHVIVLNVLTPADVTFVQEVNACHRRRERESVGGGGGGGAECFYMLTPR